MTLYFNIRFPLVYGEYGFCQIGNKKYDIKVDEDAGWYFIRGLENHGEFCKMLHDNFPDLFPKQTSDLLNQFGYTVIDSKYFLEFFDLKGLEKFLKFVNNYSEI